MCETCDRHRPIIIKDEPDAFRDRLRRMHILDKGTNQAKNSPHRGRSVLNLLYGRARHNTTVLTDKGRATLEQLRKDGEL